MIKLLPLVLVILFLAGFTYFQFYRAGVTNQTVSASPTPASSTFNSQAVASSVPTSSSSTTQIIQPLPTPSPSNLEQRVKNLESTIVDLKRRIINLEQAPTTTTTTSVSTQTQTTPSSAPKTPVYIPLGAGASVATDWTSIDSLAVTLDTADYAGYSGAQLEVSIRAYQGNGKAYARLFNSTDGVAMLPSEVSASSSDYTWVTSSSFNFSTGKKTYKVQLKSLTGYETGVQNARIKVNF